MNNQNGQFDWNVFPDNVEEVLGEHFWGDLQKMIPKRGPALDMYQTDIEAVLMIEIPGVQSVKEIQLKQSGNSLMIQGTIPYVYPVSKEGLLKNERFTGSFSRVIPIPFAFSPHEIKARYGNGVLEIRIPRATFEGMVDIQIME